jgi:transcriptional regulator of acetoin/glycerol metabolism
MRSENKAGNAELAVSLGWAALAALLFCARRGQSQQKVFPAVAGNGVPKRMDEPEPGKASHEVQPLWKLEKAAIVSALEALHGDKLLAATKLGIGKTTLYRKLKKYGISVEPALSVKTIQS